ncbi:MAG: twin-arginine translocase subunit TatC [Chlamydiales bacterium]|nr:twin-arginine translocase subunit TatC [Chlamydiales bacterium]
MMRRSEFWGHVAELRRTLLLIVLTLLGGFTATFYFHDTLLTFLLKPLGVAHYVLLSPLDGFLTALKLSFWSATVLTAPLWLYVLSRFILPALHRSERRALFALLPLALTFLLGGLAFAYYVTLPLLTSFLQTFSTFGETSWALTQTVNFVLSLLIAHALCFELFALLFVLVHYDVVAYITLKSGRRYLVVGVLIIAAIFTPPDVISQLTLAAPLLLLYEANVFYAKLKQIRRSSLHADKLK